jgi:ribosomal protein S12 methylthiotransferase accessory factor
MAEAVERYSIRLHGDEQLIAGNSEDPRQCIAPDRLHFDTSTRPPESHHWMAAKSLISGGSKLVPAGYCYIHFGDGWHHTSSNGCAAGETLEAAALRGLLELVERDAVAIWWYSRSRRPAVEVDLSGGLADALQSRGRRVFVLDLTTDFGIPVMAAISARLDGGDVVIGTAAAPSVSEAVESAMLEALVLLPDSGSAETPFARWRRTASLKRSPWLTPAESSLATPIHPGIPKEPTLCLKYAVSRAAQLGLEPLVVDMTRPETGLPVARVITPGLRFWKPHFAPGRLFTVPLSLGWRRRMRACDLNPVPFFF